jgi:CopG family nickel-responsive transcriptional regulator
MVARFVGVDHCAGKRSESASWRFSPRPVRAGAKLYGAQTMKRLTMSLDDDLADAFDALVELRGYENRSEAFRDLLRSDLGQLRRVERPDGPCIATLSYLYNHQQRQLAARLTDMQHQHHELTISATHAHLDHDCCIETVILRGRTDAVQAFAQAVMAQPGVSHGNLHLVPVSLRHAHGHDHFEAATPLAAPIRTDGGL